MTEILRVEKKEERRGRWKRNEGEGEDKKEESEFSSQLPLDGSNSVGTRREERKREGKKGEGEEGSGGGRRNIPHPPPYARTHVHAGEKQISPHDGNFCRERDREREISRERERKR